ncbi:Protein of unknown function (DUF4241) [Lentzea flava]|nr:Protein of unknown function (DUF4241) [Lentzea flava]
MIRDEPAVSWELAMCVGKVVAELGDDDYFGYPVDGGVGSFVDAANLTTLCENETYSDQLLSNLDIYLRETGHTAVADDKDRPLVVAFPVGNGDGHYPTWVGLTAGGEVACFLTDFFVLTDDCGSESEEP